MIGKKVMHYEITEEIGRGGMGIVYKANDTKLKRTVALKFLPLAVGPEDRARFEVEAQSVAHLQHPNICGIHEINEIDGQTFIVMPYIDGAGLKNLTAAGPMDIPEAVEVAIQVAHALQEAHEHDIIHRDIKSANVIITRKGLVKVMDFGLAKRKGTTQITQAGTSLGTVDYMSPEQAGGYTVDHRTDIWSLGVLLYEMLTGKMPFGGEFDQATVYSIVNQDPAPASTLRADTPPQLDEVLARALAKNPDERYQSIEEMLADLLEIQDEIGAPSTIGGSTAAVAGRPSTGSRFRSTAATARKPAAVPMGRGRLVLIVGLYVAAAALLLLGLTWSVDHFPISPHLPGFALSALAALLPAVVVLARFRGGHVLSKFGVPVYIIAAAALMFFAFQDKDLGAATKTVRVTDEEGNTIERDLPKGQFRKRFAIFYIDNKSGDPSLDWMSYGISQMLKYDLNQDTYTSFGLGFTYAHKEAGYDKPVGSPLSLKRDFANRYHYPRFVAGSFDKENKEYVVDLELYDTNSGRKLTERRYRGEVMSTLVDTMSVQLRRDLGIPDYHIAENPDLPVAEMFTKSPRALEHYVNAVNAIWQHNDRGRAVSELNQAIAIDPAFAMAYWLLVDAYTSLNRGDEAEEAMRQALTHKYRLPENEQYQLKQNYYERLEDSEAMFENASRWAALHPEAPGAHEALAQHYEHISDIESAIAERKTLFELDPQRYSELHAIGRLYETLGDDEEALRYYEKYAELHPDKPESFTTLGWFHWRRGDYAKARNYYKKALLVDPERVSIRINLAEIERHTGYFAASLEQCQEALTLARTPVDSVTALWQLVEYHMFRGEAKKALQQQITAIEKMRQTRSPLDVMIIQMSTLATYVDAGRFDEAISMLRSIEQQLNIPFVRPAIAGSYITVYAVNDDPAYLPEVEKYTTLLEKWINESGMQQYEWAVEYSEALVEYWRGNKQTAVGHIENGLDKITPDQHDTMLWMLTSAAELSRDLENYGEALHFLDRLFELEPFSPEGHLEAARVYNAQGQTEKAIEHLKKALHVWENADPDHPRARRARELAEQLRITS
jgi:tetratricopeptide (TPR) repeat protein/predicted Ser/Thr protein kinase